jgi:hypothetical protein
MELLAPIYQSCIVQLFEGLFATIVSPTDEVEFT